jgi:hypothetical protein
LRPALVLAVAVATVLAPEPAGADCAPAGAIQARLQDATVVFVGRVVSTTDNGRTARVRVEQVWKGAPVSDRVTVQGGPDGEGGASSVDRTFDTGLRYLFVPTRDGGNFRDSSCSATVEYSAAVAQFAPDTVTLPRRSSTGSSGLARQGAIALTVVLAGVLLSIAASRRRRRRPPVSSS